VKPDPDTLAQVPAFSSLSAADRQALALCFRGRRYPSGMPVFREGEPGHSLFLVGEGTLVATTRAGGVLREIGRYGAGEVLGATALLERAPRPATVTTLGATTLFELDAESVDLLRPTAPAAARALLAAAIRGLLARLRRLEQRVEQDLERAGSP
jgi:CRP-like cAMP-binding protein